MSAWVIFGIVILNTPLYIWFFKFFFKDISEFNKALMSLVRPSIITILRGEYWDDFGTTLKVAMYFIMCGVVVFIEVALIKRLLEL